MCTFELSISFIATGDKQNDVEIQGTLLEVTRLAKQHPSAQWFSITSVSRSSYHNV